MRQNYPNKVGHRDTDNKGEQGMEMTNEQGFAMIGKRAEELAKDADVQLKMVDIANSESKEAAERYLYMLAIATLCGA